MIDGSVENEECRVRSVERAKCGKGGVWKMRSVENVEHFNFNMKVVHVELVQV